MSWLDASLNSATAPTTLTLAINAAAQSLAAGTHTAAFPIESTDPLVADVIVTVTLTVTASAWLTTHLDSTQAPALLELCLCGGSMGVMAPGIYTATFPVNASGPLVSNSGVLVTVTLTITAAATYPKWFTTTTVVRGAASADLGPKPLGWNGSDSAVVLVEPDGFVTQLAAGGAVTARTRSGRRFVSVTTPLP